MSVDLRPSRRVSICPEFMAPKILETPIDVSRLVIREPINLLGREGGGEPEGAW